MMIKLEPRTNWCAGLCPSSLLPIDAIQRVRQEVGDATVEPHPLGDRTAFVVVGSVIIIVIVGHDKKVGYQEQKPQKCNKVGSNPHG